jgi:DNA polymerase V
MKITQPPEIDSITPVAIVTNLSIPLFSSNVQAGFASPADDFIEDYLDLNALLVKNEQATYFVRVAGRSMTGANIYPGDILIVDRSIEPKHNKIIIAVIDGEVTVKRLYNIDGKVILKAENHEYSDIPIEGELNTWGVVVSIIHQV